jgi:hypothetical protein
VHDSKALTINGKRPPVASASAGVGNPAPEFLHVSLSPNSRDHFVRSASFGGVSRWRSFRSVEWRCKSAVMRCNTNEVEIMHTRHLVSLRRAGRAAVIVAIVMATAPLARAGQGMAQGRGRMMMRDAAHMGDMRLIHELLDNGAKVRRTVTVRADGVETLTESDNPAIAKTIQDHVASMYGRVTDARPIHLRDPLFRAIFEHASQISFSRELTANGIRVVETSSDPYVVKLIQAHAEVLNQFIKNGRAEAMKNHDVPKP